MQTTTTTNKHRGRPCFCLCPFLHHTSSQPHTTNKHTHVHTKAATILETFIKEDPPRHMTEGVVANLASLYELLGDK